MHPAHFMDDGRDPEDLVPAVPCCEDYIPQSKMIDGALILSQLRIGQQASGIKRWNYCPYCGTKRPEPSKM